LLAVGGIDWLATGGSDGAVHVWDVARPARRLTLRGGARGLAFHPAGRLLAAASLVRTVRVWDVRSGRLLRELAGHDDAVNCVAYSPDGRRLASAADDHTVRLWDAESGALLGVTELDTQVKALGFTPDGRSLYTGNGNTSCYQLKVQWLLNDDR
jgi:WD40 repeat protein